MKNVILSFVFIFVLYAITGCQSTALYPIDDKPDPALANLPLTGKWKFAEDTNHNNFYMVAPAHEPYKFHVRFYDRGGTNATYEANIFLSKVGGSLFINIPCAPLPIQDTGEPEMEYFFLKILEADKNCLRMTTATFYDAKMMGLTSCNAVRACIAAHLKEKHYYHDTVHFYKVP